MKVNVSVEATAQEMREFLGLPNIQPLHDDMMQSIRDNVKRGSINFESFNQFFKPLLPVQLHSMEMVQKFWEAVAKANIGAKEGGDKKTAETPEARGETGRNEAKKSS
ncbi:MAG: hypothetical protein JNM60_05230 [Candidatus Competibacteraceae bacterium]|nr:hypothetical protein [Candidatus Competibacteraceae bacterium]